MVALDLDTVHVFRCKSRSSSFVLSLQPAPLFLFLCDVPLATVRGVSTLLASIAVVVVVRVPVTRASSSQATPDAREGSGWAPGGGTLSRTR